MTSDSDINSFIEGTMKKQALQSKFLVTAKGWGWQILAIGSNTNH